MGYAAFLSTLFPDSYNTNGEVLSALLGAVGAVLDSIDPYGSDYLPYYFSVTKANDSALDANGADWGVTRLPDETNDAYRARILAVLPAFQIGPILSGISDVVKAFTGTAPVLTEWGLGAFKFSETGFSDAYFCSKVDLFTLEVAVQNPDGVSYNHLNLEEAVEQAKPGRSTAVIDHNGTDTSILGEATNAVVTVL